MDRVRRKPFQNATKSDRIYMDLNEIMREHALRYLPAKALQRSRAVCRDWKLQISSPFFIHNQSISFSSVSGFFIQSPGKPPSFISHDRMAHGVADQELKFLPEAVDVKASSNGLLCCQGRSGDKPYYVCNPVNKQWKKLPKPTANHGSNPRIAFEFVPSLLNFLPEYKVVCIFDSTDIEEAYEFEIYSSLKDSWKISSEMFFSTKGLKFSRGTTVNGVAYWPTSMKILAFDLNKGKATEIYSWVHSAISIGHPYSCNSNLGMMDGKLCRTSASGLSIKVSVLNNIHVNTMPKKAKAAPCIMKHLQLNSADMGLRNTNQVQVLFAWDGMFLLQSDGKVFIHDMKTMTTTLCSLSPLDPQCEAFPYVNSLVSLV